jgi:1-pyrroline-4-hydroxy-2-carboxylate deaminase
MDRNSVDWRGYLPAAPTPFADNGAFDEGSMRSLLDLYCAAGVHGVLINGSAGEWWSETAGERRRVAEVAVDAIAGRIPVIIGCTSFTARDVISLGAHAASIGASGILTTPPPYAHPTQDEIVDFYTTIDAAVELPIVAYNWPRGTAVELSLEAATRIAGLEHVVAIKNSTSDWILVLDYIEALADQVRIFASLISPRGLAVLRELGGDGYIDGGGVGAPFAVPFFEALWDGRLDQAREYAVRYAKLTSALIAPDFSGRFGSPSSQLKAAMAMLGQPGGTVRPPLVPTTDPARLAGIELALSEAGLLATSAAAS